MAGGGVADGEVEPAGETPQQAYRRAAAKRQDSAAESAGCSKGK